MLLEEKVRTSEVCKKGIYKLIFLYLLIISISDLSPILLVISSPYMTTYITHYKGNLWYDRRTPYICRYIRSTNY